MSRSALIAGFPDAASLTRAIFVLRRQGYHLLEAYSPYQVHEVEEALGYRRSRLPRIVFVGGVLGASAAYSFQWAINVELYPLNVGGRPYHFPFAFVPITFEMGVLFAAFTAFFSVLVVGRLLRWWRPVFELDEFRSASNDCFWLQVDESDPRYDVDEAARLLHEQGARCVTRVGERRAS